MTSCVTPLIVGIGGTPRAESATERSLKAALALTEQFGARTIIFDGQFLASLPHFNSQGPQTPEQVRLLRSVEQADGIILATPSYHGAISGLLKNALDTLDHLRDSHRPYLEGRAVGFIVTSAGRQAAGTTLTTLRVVAHAMRGWPTPFAATLDGSRQIFGPDSAFVDPGEAAQVEKVVCQVIGFAKQTLYHTEAY